MKIKILVAYATTHGSSQEVAETVAKCLHESGCEAEIQPAKQVKTLDGYDAVVLGAPLYMFKLHKDAFRFLSRFKDSLLKGISVAVFAGGPFGEVTPQIWEEVRQNLDKELARESWLKPVSVLVVGGKFDPNSLRFPYNLIPAMKQQPASDFRDWEAIRRWASALAAQIQLAKSH